jgi:hypothetical protein
MMWLAALIVIVPIAAVVWRVIQVHRERLRHWTDLDTSGVRRGLEMLLKRGYDGGFVVLTEVGTDRFLQFRKYISAPGDFGIHMQFPRTTWSEQYYGDVLDLVQRRRLKCSRIPLTTPPTNEFLEVDFERNVDDAVGLACGIITEVFKSSSIRVRLSAEDICPIDDVVDRVDYPRVGQLFRDAMRRRFAK